MPEDWRIGYRRAVGEFLMEKGVFVEERFYPRDDWTLDEPDPTDYDDMKVTYGWEDYEHKHGIDWRTPPVPPCPTISVDPSTMRERSLSQFVDTFSGNRDEVGVEVRATCACGQYIDKWLRWTGTVGDILPALLEADE